MAPEPERPPGTSRPPLSAARLRDALLAGGGLWTALELVAETGSTNADAVAAARDGAPEGLVVVAEHQHAGRGRAGRSWTSPPRAGLAVSVLLRPGGSGNPGGSGDPGGDGGSGGAGREWPPAPVSRWGWLPLLAAVAVAEQVTRTAGVTVALKWPNDLLVAGRKCGGLLAEIAGDTVVVGLGLNVTLRPEELPAVPPGALPVTSLALAGAGTTDREELLRAVLDRLAGWYGRWRVAGGDAGACGLRAAYLRCCATVGHPVRVALPDGSDLTGVADTVDRAGRLVVRTPTGSRTLTAGDVMHVRAGSGTTGGCAGGAEPLR